MAKDLSKIAKQKKIKYFLISFVDLFGVLRSKLVPAQAIKKMQKNGAGFAGFADRKSTRLNSSHKPISYAVFCLKKKTKRSHHTAN